MLWGRVWGYHQYSWHRCVSVCVWDGVVGLLCICSYSGPCILRPPAQSGSNIVLN